MRGGSLFAGAATGAGAASAGSSFAGAATGAGAPSAGSLFAGAATGAGAASAGSFAVADAPGLPLVAAIQCPLRASRVQMRLAPPVDVVVRIRRA